MELEEEEERVASAAAFFAARADPFAAAAPPAASERLSGETDESVEADVSFSTESEEEESVSDYSELFAEEEGDDPLLDLESYLRERDQL